MLFVEAIASGRIARRSEGRAINERLRLIAGGMDRGTVMSSLRRNRIAALELPRPLRKLVGNIEDTVLAAGLRIEPSRLLRRMSLAALISLIALMLMTSPAQALLSPGRLMLLICFSVAIAFGLPLMFITRKAERRRRKLNQQFPNALDILVRALKAGHPVASAIELLSTELADPLGSEFGLVVDEMSYGSDFRDSLHNMAERCGIDDMRMFVVSLSVQAETGGNLAEILENLSKVIRERASMYMKVRALSSEGRMTGWVLTALPILSFSALFALNPGFYLDVSGDPAFIFGFGGLLVLYAAGFYAIRRLIDLKV
jgi:tight adherence protein B